MDSNCQVPTSDTPSPTRRGTGEQRSCSPSRPGSSSHEKYRVSPEIQGNLAHKKTYERGTPVPHTKNVILRIVVRLERSSARGQAPCLPSPEERMRARNLLSLSCLAVRNEKKLCLSPPPPAPLPSEEATTSKISTAFTLTVIITQDQNQAR